MVVRARPENYMIQAESSTQPQTSYYPRFMDQLDPKLVLAVVAITVVGLVVVAIVTTRKCG